MGPDLTKDAEGNLLEWSDFVQQYDVVITTYQVLRSDFNVARAPPVRPRREDVKYVNIERPRSPLVMVEWNRVIMDEVQMVGGAKLEYVTRPLLGRVTHSDSSFYHP
jgi:E3 ubiquitin-protein ligase SHPRH